MHNHSPYNAEDPNYGKSYGLGGGLTLPAFNTAITNTETALADYNQALAAADDKSNSFVTADTTLKDLSERMLAGVGARFGNSSQYEQAGGVRKSERKSPTRKTKPPAP